MQRQLQRTPFSSSTARTGITALHWAKDAASVHVLVHFGADTERAIARGSRETLGMTPVLYAASMSRVEVVRALLMHARMDARTVKGASVWNVAGGAVKPVLRNARSGHGVLGVLCAQQAGGREAMCKLPVGLLRMLLAMLAEDY